MNSRPKGVVPTSSHDRIANEMAEKRCEYSTSSYMTDKNAQPAEIMKNN